jgi:hypothetical protein
LLITTSAALHASFIAAQKTLFTALESCEQCLLASPRLPSPPSPASARKAIDGTLTFCDRLPKQWQNWGTSTKFSHYGITGITECVVCVRERGATDPWPTHGGRCGGTAAKPAGTPWSAAPADSGMEPIHELGAGPQASIFC